MQLSFKEKFSYGFGAIGKDMVYMLSANYILYYYEDLLNVDAVAIGFILLAARIFDALNDPLMGMIVAKTRTRWGRFRPWLFIGTILNAFVLYFLFSAPPALDGAGLIAYFSIFYFLWGITYTMLDIPYWSMIPFLTEGGRERENLTALVRSCSGIGGAAVAVLTMAVIPGLGGGSEIVGFHRFALITALLFVVSIVFTCLCVHEKSTEHLFVPSVREMFRSLLRNKQALTIVLAVLLINFSTQITLNLLIYFFKYDIGGENWNSVYVIFGAFGGALQILSMIFFYPLVRKKINSISLFRICCLMGIIGYALLLLLMMSGSKSVYLLMIPGSFIFIASGFLSIMNTVFLANTVDYGEVLYHHREESIIFSMQTFAVKLASGISAFVVSICLSVCQLGDATVSNVATAASADSITALRLTMSVIPMLGFAVIYFIFKRNYILTDKKLAEITLELQQRNSNKQ